MTTIDCEFSPIWDTVKYNLYHDALLFRPHTFRMGKREEKLFNRAVMSRVRLLRQARGWTMTDTARALGLEYNTYKHYEQRSLMPLYLLVKLASLAGEPIETLLGQSERPMAAPPETPFQDESTQERPVRRARRPLRA